jgi:hypothetical protein
MIPGQAPPHDPQNPRRVSLRNLNKHHRNYDSYCQTLIGELGDPFQVVPHRLFDNCQNDTERVKLVLFAQEIIQIAEDTAVFRNGSRRPRQQTLIRSYFERNAPVQMSDSAPVVSAALAAARAAVYAAEEADAAAYIDRDLRRSAAFIAMRAANVAAAARAASTVAQQHAGQSADAAAATFLYSTMAVTRNAFEEIKQAVNVNEDAVVAASFALESLIDVMHSAADAVSQSEFAVRSACHTLKEARK